jgi:hypothetical protein
MVSPVKLVGVRAVFLGAKPKKKLDPQVRQPSGIVLKKKTFSYRLRKPLNLCSIHT